MFNRTHGSNADAFGEGVVREVFQVALEQLCEDLMEVPGGVGKADVYHTFRSFANPTKGCVKKNKALGTIAAMYIDLMLAHLSSLLSAGGCSS